MAMLMLALALAIAFDPGVAPAQPAPSDSTAAGPDSISQPTAPPQGISEPPAQPEGSSEPSAPPRRIESRLRRTGEDVDRIELGAAMPDDYFDVLGTVEYRRFLREGGPFEQWVAAELSGGHKDYLSEGTFSLYYFFRPIRSYRAEWKLRPLAEIGPGLHLSVQAADVEGFNSTAYRSRLYAKSHLYGGAELLLSRKLGVVLRGRLSVPAHHPFDYAQAAIFLR
jgi:hypothetical protein